MYRSRALGLLLALGLALRLLYGLAQDPLAPYGSTGGDDPWYLANALALVTNAPPGTAINGIPTYVPELGQPPVFFLVAGIPQALLPPGPAVVTLRILQALATTVVAFFGFGLAARLVLGLPNASAASAKRAGLLAAAALAVSPALILESAQVKTESLFIFFVTGGVWAYVEALARSRGLYPQPDPGPHPQPDPGPHPQPLSLRERGADSAAEAVLPLSVTERGPGGEVAAERGPGGEVAAAIADYRVSPHPQPNAGPHPQPDPSPHPQPLSLRERGADSAVEAVLPLSVTERGPGGEVAAIGPGGEVAVVAAGDGGLRWWLLAGVLLGLAALTRAVFVLFPLALGVFTPFALGWRPGWKRALALLVVYAAVVLSWTVYNAVRYQRIVIAGSGLSAFIYIGATGWDDPEVVDQRLEDTLGPAGNGSRDNGDFLNAAGSAIGADLPGYLAHRLGELGGSLLQPHNVEVFPGASLRAMALAWWNTDRSPAGLLALTQGDAFWPKLLLYLFHSTAWLFGLAGMLLTRRNWRIALPLLGFIAYTLLIHLFLLALPRYLFPVMPFVWAFAAVTMSAGLDRLSKARH